MSFLFLKKFQLFLNMTTRSECMTGCRLIKMSITNNLSGSNLTVASLFGLPVLYFKYLGRNQPNGDAFLRRQKTTQLLSAKIDEGQFLADIQQNLISFILI